jgi:hypothetical protein
VRQASNGQIYHNLCGTWSPDGRTTVLALSHGNVVEVPTVSRN